MLLAMFFGLAEELRRLPLEKRRLLRLIGSDLKVRSANRGSPGYNYNLMMHIILIIQYLAKYK